MTGNERKKEKSSLRRPNLPGCRNQDAMVLGACVERLCARLTTRLFVVSIALTFEAKQPGASDKRTRTGKAVKIRCGGATVTG